METNKAMTEVMYNLLIENAAAEESAHDGCGGAAF